MPIKEEIHHEEIKETYINWHPFILKWGWLIYYLIIFSGFTFFASQHENDFGGLTFVWHSLIAGILLGIFIFLIFRICKPALFSDKNKSTEIAFYTILIVVFLVICLGPLINAKTSKQKTECKKFKIIEPGKLNQKESKYLFIETETGKERFMPPRTLIRKLKPTDSTIILCIGKGGLGYKYVKEFKLP